MKYPNLFSPYRIKNTVFRNRIFAAPNGTKHKTTDGYPLEFEVTIFESRAKGGSAVVTTGNSSVDPRYRDQMPSRSIGNFNNTDCLPYLTEVALGINRHGAVASIELNHAGPMANPVHSDGRNPIGPTATVRADGVTVEEMIEQDIEEAIEAFAVAAETSKTCLFNMCLIHGGHGWLIGSFLSERSNRRGDAWGGSLENRARLAIEICRRIRQRCGSDFLIEFRISATEFVEGGITLEESIAYAKLLEPYIDILHVSAAGLSTSHHNPDEKNDPKFYSTIWSNCPTPHVIQDCGCFIEFAAAMKNAGIKTPIVAVGAITDAAIAEEAIAEGKCDFVAMARALIADPDLPNKAKAGKTEEIRPCIRCEKCNDRHVSRQCSVNPEMGRFVRMLYVDQNPTPRKVCVIGGGPGGMQAAITAHDRGHDVTLFEKSDHLGGLIATLSRDYLKREMKPYLDYMIRKTMKAATVRLNTEATPEMLKAQHFDHVIAALGSDPIVPEIPGIGAAHVITAQHFRDENLTIGHKVALIGGGITNCEVAFELARERHEVCIIEVLSTLFPERDKISRNYSMPILAAIRADDNVTIHTETKCTGILEKTVRIVRHDVETEIETDTVIIGVGRRPRSEAVDNLWHCAPEFRPVGDCVSPRFILDATSEAFFAALDIQ